MPLTTYYLQEKIEKLFRQEWMRNEDWNRYYSFLVSKGFKSEEIMNSLQKETDTVDSHKLNNYISDYVASLL